MTEGIFKLCKTTKEGEHRDDTVILLLYPQSYVIF